MKIARFLEMVKMSSHTEVERVELLALYKYVYKGERSFQLGGADIFLDHLPINVRYRSSCYQSKTHSVLYWTHSSE